MVKKITLDDFSDILQKKAIKIQDGLLKAIRLCCEQVRSTALDDMAKTPRNVNVTYYSGKNRNIEHRPSLPGNPPAPDTGNLRASIRYTVEGENKKTIGRVGTDVEYGKHLEFGTSKMPPRPWLKSSLEKNKTFIKNTIKEVLK